VGVLTGSFISTDRREGTCTCIDFSVDDDLIAGTNEGFAFPHLEDVLCSRAVPVVQRRCRFFVFLWVFCFFVFVLFFF